MCVLSNCLYYIGYFKKNKNKLASGVHMALWWHFTSTSIAFVFGKCLNHYFLLSFSVAWSVHVLISSSRTWKSGRTTCCPQDSLGKNLILTERWQQSNVEPTGKEYLGFLVLMSSILALGSVLMPLLDSCLSYHLWYLCVRGLLCSCF